MTDPDQIKAEIERTRAELADTVDALTTKLDVKTQAKQRAADTQAKLAERWHAVTASAPEPVQQALTRAGELARPVATKAGEDKKRSALVAGGAVLLLMITRRMRRRQRRRRSTATITWPTGQETRIPVIEPTGRG
jgi:hypothetical protein